MTLLSILNSIHNNHFLVEILITAFFGTPDCSFWQDKEHGKRKFIEKHASNRVVEKVALRSSFWCIKSHIRHRMEKRDLKKNVRCLYLVLLSEKWSHWTNYKGVEEAGRRADSRLKRKVEEKHQCWNFLTDTELDSGTLNHYRHLFQGCKYWKKVFLMQIKVKTTSQLKKSKQQRRPGCVFKGKRNQGRRNEKLIIKTSKGKVNQLEK